MCPCLCKMVGRDGETVFVDLVYIHVSVCASASPYTLQGQQDSSPKKHPTDRAGCVQLRVVSPQHDMYSISHNTLCSTTVKCMTDTQLYCLEFMFLVYTYGVCHVIL